MIVTWTMAKFSFTTQALVGGLAGRLTCVRRESVQERAVAEVVGGASLSTPIPTLFRGGQAVGIVQDDKDVINASGKAIECKADIAPVAVLAPRM